MHKGEKTSSHWSHQSHFHATSFGQGSCRVLNSRKNLEICTAIFQTLKKARKWRLGLEKMARSLDSFCFGQILFKLAHMFPAHHEKSFAVVFLRCLLITYLITLSLEKKLLLWKKTGKSLESVRTLFGKDVDAFLFSFKRPMS